MHSKQNIPKPVKKSTLLKPQTKHTKPQSNITHNYKPPVIAPLTDTTV